MRKAYILLILGIWLAILPQLGFYYSWKDNLTSLSGLVLIFISFIFYREYTTKEVKKETFENFSENQSSNEEKTDTQ
ncbi:MAG: hypothetical protein WCG28_02110 [bacterium]